MWIQPAWFFAASLLIRSLGESFLLPCCFNDNHRGGGAKGRGWGWLQLLTLCNAARQLPPSTSTTTPAELPCKSVPVPFQLLGSAWAFTNSSSQSLTVQSLVFAPPPRSDISPVSLSSLIPPHLPSSPISACSICLSVHFPFYGLESLL